MRGASWRFFFPFSTFNFYGLSHCTTRSIFLQASETPHSENYGFAARSLAERTIRWNAMGECCRLRTMYKRIVVLGIVGLSFALGANYLLVYTLNRQVVRERERQDRVYWSTFNVVIKASANPAGKQTVI